MERSLILLKPDAIQRALVGEVIARFERRGLKIVALKMVQVSAPLAHRHYAVHKGQPFYDGLIEYITSGPVVVMAVEGPDAIALVRATVGATRPAEAGPGTIRGDFGSMVGRNLIHASDGPDTARQELALWFEEGELLDYARALDAWVFE